MIMYWYLVDTEHEELSGRESLACLINVESLFRATVLEMETVTVNCRPYEVCWLPRNLAGAYSIGSLLLSRT